MQDQQTAAAQLAGAHRQMTRAEVEEHACCLASVIESQETFIVSLLDLIDRLQVSVSTHSAALNASHETIRKAVSLHKGGMKRASRELLAAAAGYAVAIDQPPPFERSAFVPTVEAWPDAFTPKGSLA
ncbi:hypothetical protein GOB15_23765 [Sinorhizobium meliloti]|nr:hypothetical protein [Sinorhizobium meliloti]MDW9512862.1 hypothetical protein [Sinorhizobium meliloti]